MRDLGPALRLVEYGGHAPTAAAAHLLAAAPLALGGLLHAAAGPARLEDAPRAAAPAFRWADRVRLASVLGAHLGALAAAALALAAHALASGPFDAWAGGGGAARALKASAAAVSPAALGL